MSSPCTSLFYVPQVCFRTLDLYTGAVLEAVIDPPTDPKPEWRAMMAKLATKSCNEYRNLVGGTPGLFWL